jgi:hypothetical protein
VSPKKRLCFHLNAPASKRNPTYLKQIFISFCVIKGNQDIEPKMFHSENIEEEKYALKMLNPCFMLIFPCLLRLLISNIYAFKTMGYLNIESHSENENIEEEKDAFKMQYPDFSLF